ncbi:MAG: SDR family oxidoreductase [Armatimonadota bacterium]
MSDASGQSDAVTGAGGFTGRHITARLIAAGKQVINLTGHPERAAGLGDAVRSVQFDFGSPDKLARDLEGVTTLFNTYWIRFERGSMTFDTAVANSRALIQAAKLAGVKRIVHISITNPSLDSPFGYYRGKAAVEAALKESGLSYAILRPAMLFGDGGVLINNLAWFLRRLPVFAIPGSGNYWMQPVFVEDLADLAIQMAERSENIIIDAVGPEVFTFNEMVKLLARTVGSRTWVMHIPPSIALPATGLLGLLLRDVVLTRDEIRALSANLLISSSPPTCPTRLTDWLASHAESIGRTYISDLRKHYS